MASTAQFFSKALCFATLKPSIDERNDFEHGISNIYGTEFGPALWCLLPAYFAR